VHVLACLQLRHLGLAFVVTIDLSECPNRQDEQDDGALLELLSGGAPKVQRGGHDVGQQCRSGLGANGPCQADQAGGPEYPVLFGRGGLGLVCMHGAQQAHHGHDHGASQYIEGQAAWPRGALNPELQEDHDGQKSDGGGKGVKNQATHLRSVGQGDRRHGYPEDGGAEGVKVVATLVLRAAQCDQQRQRHRCDGEQFVGQHDVQGAAPEGMGAQNPCPRQHRDREIPGGMFIRQHQ